MAFNIQIARVAEQDIVEAVEYIATDSETRAQKWFDELFIALENLRELPLGHALIPEARAIERDLRSIHHYSHRVIYEVQDSKNIIYVARVYHGA